VAQQIVRLPDQFFFRVAGDVDEGCIGVGDAALAVCATDDDATAGIGALFSADRLIGAHAVLVWFFLGRPP
jgi:hypothetical protein